MSDTEELSNSKFVSLRHRVESGQAKLVVVGLGYVGLPVAVSFAAAGFRVTGIDTNPDRVDSLNAGKSHVLDISDDVLHEAINSSSLKFERDYSAVRETDIVLICVPTPVKDGRPDLSSVEASARAVAGVLRPGMLVILESTTYPGTTEELVAPILEASGLRCGDEFLLAYSPERIDPGNVLFGFQDIPKIVGGVGPLASQIASTLYETVVPKTIVVSSPREAELAKLIENTFRHVNIALVNELAVYAGELRIDIWEAIEAASTKPFGFMPFWPGPGWGGHCIPLDPVYLSWRIRRERDHEVRFVELAHAVNSEMPRYVVSRAGLLLNEQGKPVKHSRVLGIGVAYKGGTGDTRESPAVKVLKQLAQQGAEILYHDPLVQEMPVGEKLLQSTHLDPRVLHSVDLVLVLVNQTGVDWDLIKREARLVLDCCNALGKVGPGFHRL